MNHFRWPRTSPAMGGLFLVGLLWTGDLQAQSHGTVEQRIAEAIWAFVSADGYDEKVDWAVTRLTKEFPNSPEAAFWEAHLRALDAEATGVYASFAEHVDSVFQDIQPGMLRAGEMALTLHNVQERLEALVAGRDQLNSVAKANVAALRCVQLDPEHVLAWALMTKSSHRALALMACQRWSEVEPDNAMPHFARASILEDTLIEAEKSQDRESLEPKWEQFWDAIRQGVRCPQCTVPQVQLPTHFQGVVFDGMWVEEIPSLAGKPVSPAALAYLWDVRAGLFSWADSSPLSTTPYRYLDSRVLKRIADLPDEKQVGILHDLIRLHQLFLRSNSFLHAIDRRAEPAIARLVRIATNHRDWPAVAQYQQVLRHMRQTRIAVSEGYVAAMQNTTELNSFETIEYYLSSDFVDIGSLAQEITQARGPAPKLPEIDIQSKVLRAPQLVADPASIPNLQAGTAASTTMLHGTDVDFVRLDVFQAAGLEPIVSDLPHLQNTNADWLFEDKQRADGRVYIEDLSLDELEQLVYRDTALRLMSLSYQSKLIDALSRTRRRSVGLYIVLRSPLAGLELPTILENSGYLNARDACVVAAQEVNSLAALRDHTQVRTAWIVPATKLLTAYPQSLRETLSTAEEASSGIALWFEDDRFSEEDLARVRAAMIERDLFLHFIEPPDHPLPHRIRKLASVVVIGPTTQLNSEVASPADAPKQ